MDMKGVFIKGEILCLKCSTIPHKKKKTSCFVFFYQISSQCLFCNIFLTPCSLMSFAAGIQARIKHQLVASFSHNGQIGLRYYTECWFVRDNLLSLFFFSLSLPSCCDAAANSSWGTFGNELPDAHTCAVQQLENWNWPQVTLPYPPTPLPISEWSFHETASLLSGILKTHANTSERPWGSERSCNQNVILFLRFSQRTKLRFHWNQKSSVWKYS